MKMSLISKEHDTIFWNNLKQSDNKQGFFENQFKLRLTLRANKPRVDAMIAKKDCLSTVLDGTEREAEPVCLNISTYN